MQIILKESTDGVMEHLSLSLSLSLSLCMFDVCARARMCMHAFVYVPECVRVCMHVYVCVCMYMRS